MTTEHSTDLERRDGGVPGDPFPDPGFPAHEPRFVDRDERANKTAERQVAGLFALSSLASVAFIVVYVAIPLNGDIGRLQQSNRWLGLCLTLMLLGLGLGAIHWAKKVMTSSEIVQERHDLSSSPEAVQGMKDDFVTGVQESGFGRRTLIRNSLLGAFVLLPLPVVVLFRDLGPVPGNKLAHTIWAKGVRCVNDVTFTPVKPEDIEIGQLVNVMPATFEDLPHEGAERQVERAKVPVMLIRMQPADFKVAKGRENWNVDGIVGYSKICTHVGCPINLYEQQTHHLLCPCHQSTFDLSDNGRVVFGPAARSLPQLPLYVDNEGYLAARSDFTEPVGPSYWERG